MSQMSDWSNQLPPGLEGVKYLADAQLQSRADQKLRRLAKETGQALAFPIDVDYLVEIVEQLTVEVCPPAHIGPNAIGAFRFEDRHILISDCIEHEGRRRFTLAHEYGHFVLHHPHYGQGSLSLFDQEAEPVMIVNRGFVDKSNQLEIQANKFASYLLLPLILIEAEMGALRGRTTAEQLTRALASRAETSVQAARIRLEGIGWIQAPSQP